MIALLLLTALLQCALSRAEASIAVVVRKDSPLFQLSREEVAALFLGKIKRSNDIAVTPIDSQDGALRDHFYRKVADMSGIRVKAYWSRIVFAGQGRPPQEVSPGEARARLAEDPGALTYLPVDHVTPDMKVIYRLP